MKDTLLIAAIAALFSGQAAAESAFEGFYTQIGTGYENNQTDLKNATAIKNDGKVYGGDQVKDMSNDGVALILGAGYNFSITPKFVLGIGGDWSAFNRNTNSSTFNCVTSNDSCFKPDGTLRTSELAIKTSDRYSVFITPSYVIDNEKLLYFKAGYTGQTVNSIDTRDNNQSVGKANLNGYLLGLGYKQIITGGLYGFGEGNWYDYSKSSVHATTIDGTEHSSNIGGSSYTLTVGVGYKF